MKVVPRYDFYNKGVIRRLFSDFDKDRNYVITRGEIQKEFAKWDRNGDGKISKAEMDNSTYGRHKDLCSRVGPLTGFYDSRVTENGNHGRRL